MSPDGPALSHSLLVAAIENSANGIVITDSAGAIQWVNPAFSDLTGYSRSEVIGKNPRILKSGSHPPEFYEELWQTILAGAPWRGQMRNRRKDGAEYIEEMTITPVRGQAGAISHFIAIKQDITRRYEAEEELRASQERLELGLEVSSQGIWDWNLVTGEAHLTRGFRRLLGYDDGDAAPVYRGGFGLIHPEDRADAEQLLVEHLGGRSQSYEKDARLRKKNGEYLRVLSCGKVVDRDDSGRPLRMIGFHSDISYRAGLEQQLREAQKIAAVGLLAGGIAHDFNNLLTVINGYGEMLLSGSQLSGQAREFLGTMRDAGDRAAALVGRLLSFSRHQAAEPKVLNVNDIVAELSRLMQRLLPQNIRLTTELEPMLGMVLADAGSIQQALMNLVVNASDAMPQGGRLRIETTNVKLGTSLSERQLKMPPGSYILLTITDTGVGMDDATQEHMFEPFYTTKPAGAGTGLGLATVYGIVRQSGGWISVYSEKGRGTSIKIYLPCVDGEREQVKVPQRAVPAGGPETILVVEDSVEVRQFACAALRNLGYTVLEASGGDEAVGVFQESADRIDLLVTDVVLPDSTGQDVARQLSATRPGLAVLYVSGYPRNFTIAEGALEPGIEFLQKPFTGDALGLRVREVLRKRKCQRILIVDDDPEVARFASRVLSDAGFESLVAGSGKDALSIVSRQSVDLLITDLFLPEQKGLETILALRMSSPSLPIIAVSGVLSGEYLKTALALGAQAAITKPFSVARLLETVERVLRMGQVTFGSEPGAPDS
ncbi:MAG TPA: response regulator [Bryobacteraceae bacterium]|nr:response regulator [Bryobacteraceae bacterium]